MIAKTIGMLGGGQLGMMAAQAGTKLGLETHVYCPETGAPASQVAAQTTNAAYEDKATLKAFADSVDAITYEFENIPADTVRFLETLKPVFPSSKVLEVAQERIAEKTAMNSFGLPTTRFAPARNAHDIQAIMQQWGATSCIIKTVRFGYDGKGQALIRTPQDAGDAFARLKADIVIVEEVVDFAHEISVIVARDQFGAVGSYTPGLNVHQHHILHTTTVPAPLPKVILEEAQIIAETLAGKIQLVGVLGVEMFVTKDNRLLVNEIAPRPHNSGHWTIDACTCSQFEQQMRAVSGMKLGSFDRHHDAVMTNLLGDDIHKGPDLARSANTFVTDYGKTDAKPGRKMGHVTVLGKAA
jgi:5-(carboxyamino)imidazole ribonucleotide synthase